MSMLVADSMQNMFDIFQNYTYNMPVLGNAYAWYMPIFYKPTRNMPHKE